MSEILDKFNSVDNNGDVMINPGAMLGGSSFTPWRAIRDELFAEHSFYTGHDRLHEDVVPKINPLYVANEKRLHLVNAIRLIGRSNRAQGATLRGDVDRAKFGGEAEAHAMNFTEQARQEIETACDMCAVRGLCSVVKSLLHERLEEDSTARRRLRDRLNADNVKGQPDKITCERYMTKRRTTESDR